MTTILIRPLPGGTAVVAMRGVDVHFPSWLEAAAECDARLEPWHLERFPLPSPVHRPRLP